MQQLFDGKWKGENHMVGCRNALALLIFIVCQFSLLAIREDFTTCIYDNNIHSLKISKLGDFMSVPIINLNSEDKIIISFDDLSEQNRWLQYRLIHCNADWKPSQLSEFEYIDGINLREVDDYAYSTNTYVHYVNYHIQLPSEELKLIHSGNYLVQVFDRDNPDVVLLQARFRATENRYKIAGLKHSHTDLGINQQWQQIEIGVSMTSSDEINPWQDLSLHIIQNIDDYSLHVVKHPTISETEQLLYNHQPELIFPAGNEYRRFETISNVTTGIGIDSISFKDGCYHFWLNKDEAKTSLNYQYDRTQHGRFLIRENNASDSDIAADYAYVNFRLGISPLSDYDIYVDGEFTLGKFNNLNRLVWDESQNCYTLNMLLKQGAYNYRYLVKPRNLDNVNNVPLIDGNKHETDNEYNLYLYCRRPGDRADRLIATGKI